MKKKSFCAIKNKTQKLANQVKEVREVREREWNEINIKMKTGLL